MGASPSTPRVTSPASQALSSWGHRVVNARPRGTGLGTPHDAKVELLLELWDDTRMFFSLLVPTVQPRSNPAPVRSVPLSPAAVTCPVLSAPEHGELNCSHLHGNFTFNSTCDFSCQPGFELTGPQSRECTAMGNWTGDTTQCKGRAASKGATGLRTALGCSLLH